MCLGKQHGGFKVSLTFFYLEDLSHLWWLLSLGCMFMTSQVVLLVKNLPPSAGDTRDMGSILGWGRSPRVGYGNPRQSSCLENSMDRGAWQVPVRGVSESDTTEWLSTAQHGGYHVKFFLQFTVNRKRTLNHVNLLKFLRFLFSLAGWNVFILSSFLSNIFADCRILGCHFFDLFTLSK